VTVTVFRGRCCQRQNNPPPVFPSFPLWNARKPGPRRRCVEGSSTDRTNACVYWDSLCEPGSPFRFLLSRSSAHQFSFAFNFARTKSQRIPRFVELRGSGAPLAQALEVDRPSYVKRKSPHTKNLLGPKCTPNMYRYTFQVGEGPTRACTPIYTFTYITYCYGRTTIYY